MTDSPKYELTIESIRAVQRWGLAQKSSEKQYAGNLLAEIERSPQVKNVVSPSSEEIKLVISAQAAGLKTVIKACAGRSEYAEKTVAAENELEFLQRFLPKKFTQSETNAIVSSIIQEQGIVSKNEKNKIFKAVKTYGDQIDGNLVNKAVDELLS